MISATSFSLAGVVNKFITVLLNATLWNKHSSTLGMVAVCGCLIAGTFYEQSPMRETADNSTVSIRKSNKSRRVVAAGPPGSAPSHPEESESLLEMGKMEDEN